MKFPKGLSILCAMAGLLSAQNAPMAGHPEDYERADIEYGARLYSQQCERCHGENGAGVSGVDLASGKFRNVQNDRQLMNVITTGFPAAGMPPFKFDTTDLTGVVAYLRNMKSLDRGSLTPGDAARGKAVFEGRGACLSCHRVNGNGSRKGPDLSDVGSLRSPGYLERVLVDPSGQMFPIDRPVHIVTRAGRTIDGRRLNEDTYTVQLADTEGRLVSLVKSDLREFTIATKSPMPSYKGELSTGELADLAAYLLSLKGQ